VRRTGGAWALAAALLAAAPALAAPTAPAPDAWWTRYGDPQLDALMADALARSPSLAQARARIAAADAEAGLAHAPLSPTLDLAATAQGQKVSRNAGFPPQFVPRGYRSVGQIGADFGLALDIWGRNRAAYAAAVSEAQAARLDAVEVRAALTASLATAYADFARAWADRDAAEAVARTRDTLAALAVRRWAAQAITARERDDAVAAAAVAHDEAGAKAAALALDAHRLALLAGAPPSRGEALAAPQLNAAPAAVAEAPLDDARAAEARPDVRAAALRVQAADHQVEAARSAGRPRLDLSALFGLQALGLDNLLRAGSDIGQAGLSALFPVLQGGRPAAELRRARAERDARAAALQAARLDAEREAADARSAVREAHDRRVSAEAAQAAGEASAVIVRRRYDAGLVTSDEALQAQAGLIEIHRRVLEQRARGLAAEAALVHALGALS